MADPDVRNFQLFARMVAHDFNNLLGGILGHAELIEATANESDIRESAAIIRKAAERATDLTRQLLHDAGKNPVRSVPVNLHDTIREVALLLSLDAGLRVEYALGEPNPVVAADPGQIHQMLLNLAVNARDAMPGGGTLTFETESEGGHILLTVRDTGPGIPPDLRAKIFEPFFTTKGGRGSGMGLYVVHRVAKAHGGRVELDGGASGAVFRIRLPRKNR